MVEGRGIEGKEGSAVEPFKQLVTSHLKLNRSSQF